MALRVSANLPSKSISTTGDTRLLVKFDESLPFGISFPARLPCSCRRRQLMVSALHDKTSGSSGGGGDTKKAAVSCSNYVVPVDKFVTQMLSFYASGKSDKGSHRHIHSSKQDEVIERRQVVFGSFRLIAGVFFVAPAAAVAASRSDFTDMPALRGKDYGKTKMRYPDYTETESGLQFKDLRVGTGPTPKRGDIVVVDWDGYTIGYYGRIFEARNKTKGGSFEGDDKDFFKFRVGSHEVIPAFEEAVLGMSLGGVRRIIVPPELGYPDNDYNKLGPRPTTFSGQRALDFVLRNQGLIDKTLLFDIELLKIIPS